MPRLQLNRWWTFILTATVLAVISTSLASRTRADVVRESGRDGTIGEIGGGGDPAPAGVGDPDQPVPSTLKRSQRGSLRSGGTGLSRRSAGDSRIEGSVWMWRLSAMGRVLRAYWVRY